MMPSLQVEMADFTRSKRNRDSVGPSGLPVPCRADELPVVVLHGLYSNDSPHSCLIVITTFHDYFFLHYCPQQPRYVQCRCCTWLPRWTSCFCKDSSTGCKGGNKADTQSPIPLTVTYMYIYACGASLNIAIITTLNSLCYMCVLYG